MDRILVTGATGTVGKDVICALLAINHNKNRIIAGVRNLQEGRNKFGPESGVEFQYFDFEAPGTFKPALSNCDILFLLRPPQISNVKEIFVPLIQTAKECNIKHIVFLSVQGVEKNRFIPHYKIEKLILGSKIPFTFLRPAYFMQNFTTTLRKDIVENKMIFLPAGRAKFTIIDAVDIGAVSAVVITSQGQHKNRSYELTNNEKLDFGEMAKKISAATGTEIKYVSPGLVSFYIQKRKEGMREMFVLVMIMLHYFPRFRKEPVTTNYVYTLTGKQPNTFNEFLAGQKNALTRH